MVQHPALFCFDCDIAGVPIHQLLHVHIHRDGAARGHSKDSTFLKN